MKHRLFAQILAAMLVVVGAFASFARGADEPVTVRAVPQYSAVEQGGKLVIAVEMEHAAGYHSWPAREVLLPEAVAELAIRTEVGPALDEKAQEAAEKKARDAQKPDSEIEAVRVYSLPPWARFDGTVYPQSHKGKVADPMGGNEPVEAPLYSGKAVSFIRLAIAPDAPIGDHTIAVRAAYQSCDEHTCTMPQDVAIPVHIAIVGKGAAVGSANDAALFEGFDASTWGSGAVGTAPPGAPPKESPKPQVVQDTPPVSVGSSFFGIDLGTSAALLLLFGAIGGFILNLTPCVLPVIPIKVLSLTQHATSKRHALVLGLWMAAGVVTFWTLAGIPMAVFSASLDPSRFIFGVWWLTLGIAGVIALVALGTMGLFAFSLPQSVYAVEAKADSPTGSFLFGVLTAILGLPCFGLFVGGLLAGASALPWFSIMAVFVGLGVGMAAPYLVLSVKPELLKFIPRTGPASVLVKQVMGLLLLAAAAYFAAAGIKAVLSDYPYLVGSIGWWAVAFFIAIAGLWMVVRTYQITRLRWPRVFFPLCAVAMILGIGLFADDKFRDDRDNYLALQKAMKNAGPAMASVPSGVWMNYTPELFASVRTSGRTVFLDFTADWCINCKALKRALLDSDPVEGRLKGSNIVLMEVDCTSTRAPGWELLRELQRTGVPTWVIYGPQTQTTPVIIDLTRPTAQTVLDALDRAGAPKRESALRTTDR